MTPTPEEVKVACRKRFSTFCSLMQGPGWFDPNHARLCDWLQYHVEESAKTEAFLQVLIIMPRGTLKTTLISKLFLIWMAIRSPNIRCLVATNTVPNVRKKIEDIRGVFDGSNFFRALWPELLPRKTSRWTNESAEINRMEKFPEATFEGCGRKTDKTGTHYNIIVEDDTTAPEESDLKIEFTTPSREEVERAIGWHRASVPLLLIRGTRVRIIVTTRWSEYDLVKYILDNEKNTVVFDIPVTNAEQPNFPSLYNKEKLDQIQELVGPYMFSCLYQNRPLEGKFQTFKEDWFHYIPLDEVPLEGYYTIAVDPAISEKENSCETAISRAFHHEENGRSVQYWTDVLHGHFNADETLSKILSLVKKDPERTTCVAIEANAYQASLQYTLRDAAIRANVKIKDVLPIHSRTSKKVRIEGLVPYFAAKRIFFVSGLSSQVESQLRQYPNGRLLDVIDSFAMHYPLLKAESNPLSFTVEEKPGMFSGASILDELTEKYKKAHAEEVVFNFDWLPSGLSKEDMHLEVERIFA